MSDDRVYIRFKGKTLGPLTLQKVQDLARRGQITRMHELSPDGISWVKAEEFGGVFQSSRVVADSNSSVSHGTSEEILAKDGNSLLAVSHATPRQGDVPDQGVEWYAHIGGENRGPMNTSAIQSAINSGQIAKDTLTWRAGFDEWRPASESFPQSFGQDPLMNGGRSSQAAHGPATRTAPGIVASGDVFYELHRQRPWVLLLSGLILIAGFLYAIFWVVYMVVGADSRFGGSGTGSVKVVTGLLGLIVSGIIIAAGWLLLRYATALKDIAIHRSEAMQLESARRLFLFWRYLGVAALTVIVLMAAFVAIGSMMAAGAGAGAV